MKKLPIGIQDFARLRKDDFLYVDKTKLLYQLVTEGVYYFLSRPRRFGKSLLVSTLSELFQGNRELFQGLWIEDRWDWNVQYPVIRLGLSSIGHREIGLERALQLQLEKIADSYGLKLKMEANSLRLRELIERLATQAESGKVVILIDEYDKPVLDYLHDIPQAEKNRDLLKSFYSVLKDADPYLRLVLLTGVSKFSGSPPGRVSIFSELNNLTDLTIYSDYATMLGYTQEELEHYFADRITAMASTPKEREDLLADMKGWYNGYSWDAKNFVYNPFSILSFFSKREFENFWFETGTPTFLVKLLKREQQYDFDQVLASATALGSFELDRIHPITLLFQTGYLTIRSKDENLTYTLAYPNREVRYSLLQHLLGEYVEESPSDTYVQAKQMKDALKKEDVEAFVEGLNSLFASIPYQIFIANKEAYYHSVTFLALSLMGSFIQVEVSQAKGRPDAVVHTEQVIYVMEFKLNESAEVAMDQIKKNNYLQPYLNLGKAVKAVGFNFNAEQKALDQWLEEAVG